MKRNLLLLIVFLIGIAHIHAEINWVFQVGGMYKKQYGGDWQMFNAGYDDDGNPCLLKDNNFEVETGLFMQIPVSSRIPIFIETGIGYRNKLVISQEKDYKFDPKNYSGRFYGDEVELNNACNYRGNFIEIAIKAGYKLALNEKNSFLFGLGPYVAMCTERGFGDMISVGATLSAAFRHRCLTYGLSYSNPFFLNGPRDYYKNSLNITLGINFGGKTWSKIGKVALVTAAVAGSVAVAYSAINGNDNNNSNYDTGDSDNDYNVPSQKGDGKKSNDNNNKKYNISEQQSYNTDKNTYARYDSLLSKVFFGSSEMSCQDIKKHQEAMKKIRLKWEKRGKSFTKSDNESRDCTFRK